MSSTATTTAEKSDSDNDVRVVYRCENTACPLGSRTDHGHFTDGITEAQMVARFDEAQIAAGDVTHGPDVCPTCGNKGKSTSTKFTGLVGDDPHDEVHLLVHQNVLSETVSSNNAQKVLTTAVGLLNDEGNSISKPQVAVDTAIKNL